MSADRRLMPGWALATLALVPTAALAAPPSRQAILKACDQAESAAGCERLLETDQIRQFPSIATRDGAALRLQSRAGAAPVELRDAGHPDEDSGAAYRAHAFWDYWPQTRTAIVSVMTNATDSYLVVDLDRGKVTIVPAEPLLAPDGRHFLVADTCEKRCANMIWVWRFDGGRPLPERIFTPAEKWYEADVTWQDASTLAIEYSVAAPRRRLAEPRELVLERAKPMRLKLSDSEWVVDEIKR